jgi:hypothetical protein
MAYLKPCLLAVAFWAAHPSAATAQRQASFSHWAGPVPTAPASRQSSGGLLPDSVRQKVGYQHWKGAAIGAGVGAVLGSALAFGLAGECADCTVTTWDRAKGALIITGASSALGFLVGLASPRYAWRPSPGAPDGD